MAKPLFTEAEQAQRKEELAALERRRSSGDISWNDYLSQEKALKRAQLITKVKRVQERAEEFINALIILIGSRGEKYVNFDFVFSHSDDTEIKELFNQYDTPQVRRELYTILRALTEIPKTWARSAFVRFLRGIGKQRNAKYHGAGMFGADYGWKEININAICRVIAGGDYNPYSQVLMSYIDVVDEIREQDPDFEVVDIDADVEHKAVHVERDVEFLNKLCSMLETRGLADIAKPKERGPKKAHQPKIFKAGDIIRKQTIRDLPLPAHVRVKVEKYDEKSKQWLPSQLEWVVEKLFDNGSFSYYCVGPDGKKAYRSSRFLSRERKSWLEGATYLGPWTGQIIRTKEMKYNFRYQRPEK